MSKDVAASTQEHLPIAGIQDGVVIMNDASIRAVLKVEPINFELKSETEQNAIIYSYQSFLNSLDFPIQIVVHSKKLDLERYLIHLEEAKKSMDNELLRIQTEDYVEFVRRLITVANIMSKRFYVVVSYAASTTAGMNPLTGALHKGAAQPLLDQEQFTRFRTELLNRANLIGNGLAHLGVSVTLLATQQLIELFYTIYNPEIATEERLVDVNDLNAQVVSGPQEVAGNTTEDTAAAVANEPPPDQPVTFNPRSASTSDPSVTAPPSPVVGTTPPPLQPVTPLSPASPPPATSAPTPVSPLTPPNPS